MQERGCAVNADGTLKDASEIQWSNSHSPSPDLSAIPECVPPPIALLSQLAPYEEVKDHEKPPEKWQKQNPRWPLTSAQPQPKLRTNLTYHDKIRIMEFAEGAG